MPAVEVTPVASSESGLVKMEDRKRAATYDQNDSAPPLKKHASAVNGGSKPHPDADMPWKDDLEVSYKTTHYRAHLRPFPAEDPSIAHHSHVDSLRRLLTALLL
jgi:hypothetical protein